jgi:DNA-binding transcriptional MerR regulator
MAMTIGELSKATGSKIETIRYYERIGLLPKPAWTAGNYRAYAQATLARLSLIRRARALGFPIDHVRTLLTLSDCRRQSCTAVDTTARTHLNEVEKKIAELQILRRELTDMISRCSVGTIGGCRIIEALGLQTPRTEPSVK